MLDKLIISKKDGDAMVKITLQVPNFSMLLKKYGWNNFIHKVVKSCLSREEADELEKKLISTFDTIKNGYNIKEGGSRGALTKESLNKMSASLKRGYLEHPERKLKISQKRKGIKVADETKRKISEHSPKTNLITIGDETGSIRYWAKRIKMTHPPLLYRLKKYGIENLIDYIKLKK